MSAISRDPDPSPGGSPKDSPPNATPLDHPFFLPVLFAGCAVWFGYDGYLTQDPSMLEHQDFNRHGFRVLAFLAPLWTYRGWCELKRSPESPWFLPSLIAAIAAWTAFDGWWSRDAFNLENASVLRSLVPWLLFASAWYALAAFRHPDRSRATYGFAVVLAAPALWFGFQGFVSQSGNGDTLASQGASVALAATALWSAVSDFRRGRSSPS